MVRFSICTALALSIACGSSPSTTPTPNPTPTPTAPTVVSVALSADIASLIRPGLTAQVTAMGTLANGGVSDITPACVNWFSDDQGVLTISATGLITAVGVGSATITATCQGVFGQKLVIIGFAPPVINSFSVDRSAILIGESVTLHWSVSNATSVSIDNGVGVVSSAGQQTITPPLGSTNYTLTASNSVGSASRSVSVSATSNSCAASAVPAGTTAICNDGSYSQSQNRRGTCSSHDGVRCWICPGTLCSGLPLPLVPAMAPANRQCPSGPVIVSRR